MKLNRSLYRVLFVALIIMINIPKAKASAENFSVYKVKSKFVVGITEHNRDNLYAVLHATEGSYVVYNHKKLATAKKLSDKTEIKHDYYLPIHLYMMKDGRLKQYPIRVYANYLYLLEDGGHVEKSNNLITSHVIELSKEFTLKSTFSYFRFNNGVNFYGLDSKKKLTRRNSYIFAANDSLPYIAKSSLGLELPYIDVFYCRNLKQVFKFMGQLSSSCEYGRVSYSVLYNQNYMTYLGIRKRDLKHNYQDNTLLSALSVMDVNWSQSENFVDTLIEKITDEVKNRIGKKYRSVSTWKRLTIKQFSIYVAEAAIEFNVDPWLILSVIETESSFKPDVTSHAKAMGFMQIVPRTGRWIARKLDIHLASSKDIYRPDINIRMGTWYLSYLLKRFNYNKEHVAVAYNSGPSRVYRKYVFKETRKYKKKIVRHYNMFVRSIQSKFGAFLNSEVITVDPFVKEKLSDSDRKKSQEAS